ncbi:MAG: hypothetical protein HRU70_09445 [Phycisphaeraceae bacterium]|nr:MAG: hypothetical protein HRU70_09445 [Phycisphaeraceae bacterium]
MPTPSAPSPTLSLAHSPDPDDVFMWWPLTGMVNLDGTPFPPPRGLPALDTGRLAFRSVPADIEALNRRARAGHDLFDITALSVRTWADVAGRYVITRCGASFGEGFGPKIVRRADQSNDPVTVACEGCLAKPGLRFAVPGFGTTAFLLLSLVMREVGAPPEWRARCTEMPFDQIIPAVAQRRADVGLVIHEGQLTFSDAGLREVLDTGEWWRDRTSLPLPLGVNAVRRDLDQRFGPGTRARVAELLAESVSFATAQRERSVEYTLPWAAANARSAGHEPPSRERVDRYCRMYVSPLTLDMGSAGKDAIRRLLAEGHAAGLCPDPGDVETI